MVKNEYFDDLGTEDLPIFVDEVSLDKLDLRFATNANHIHGRDNVCLKNRFIRPKDCRVVVDE